MNLQLHLSPYSVGIFALWMLLSSHVLAVNGQGLVIEMENGSPSLLYENSHALVIGIGDYKYGWDALPHALKDAEAMVDALIRRGFKVRTIFNPTSRELNQTLASIAELGGSEDRLLVYFAGHGETLTDSSNGRRFDSGYLVPVDAPKSERDRSIFLQKAISMEEIAGYATSSPVKHALFIFDCCFSGAILNIGWGTPEFGLESLFHPSRQFITAGGRDEEVPARSIFTYCLLQALDGDADLNGDGLMTTSELSVYLHDNVVQRSRDTQHPQYGRIIESEAKESNGTFYTTAGDFVFLPEPLDPAPHPDLNNNHKLRQIPSGLITHKIPDDFTPIMPELEFTYIPGRSFLMGSPYDEVGREEDEGPQHEVTLVGFYMQTTEVTQKQWQQVMGYNPSFFNGDDLPVEQVSWNDVQTFLRRLNRLDPGHGYRLPSEAEWEYACRAGSTTRFPWGDDPEYLAMEMFSWTAQTQNGKTYPVGRKRPNAWGLYDMHGNVFEWCLDWYHSTYYEAPVDGSARLSPVGSRRVYHGGGSVIQPFEYNARQCRSAYRNRGRPISRYYDVGFRIVKEVN